MSIIVLIKSALGERNAVQLMTKLSQQSIIGLR